MIVMSLSEEIVKETDIQTKFTDENMKESPLQTSVIKEITELFEIQKYQIPRSRDNEQFLLDLSLLDQNEETHTAQNFFNFLDYLIDSDRI